MLWHSKMYQRADVWEYATGECIVCWEARACVAISPCGHKFWKVPSIVPLYHMLHHGAGFWEYAAGMHSEKYPLSCFYIVTVLGLWRLRICGSCRGINSENCPLSCFYTVTILGHWRLRICGRHVCLCAGCAPILHSENYPLSCFYIVTVLGRWRLRICGRHVCLCAGCAPLQSVCPMCRGQVLSTLHLFFSTA